MAVKSREPARFLTRGENVARFIETLAHVKGPLAGEPFRLEPWQRRFIHELYRVHENGQRVYKSALLGLSRGSGKALALDTPICTPYRGWVTMGTLQVGDYVFGWDGEPTRIVAATPPLLGRDCYEMSFTSGDPIICDADHLWVTEKADQQNIPMVRRTTEIAAKPLRSVPRHGRMWRERNHRIRRASGPLQYPPVALPIPPYVLGAWLGDGETHCARITITEEPIAEKIRACGYTVERRDSGLGRHLVRGLQVQLGEIGVLHQKHIPRFYLESGEDDRWELLRGLMDTDGTCSAKYSETGRWNLECEYISTRQRLASDVLELVRSLGFRANLHTGRASLNGKDCGPKFRVIFHPNQKPVFALARKQKRAMAKTGTDRLGYVHIDDCRPTASVPVRCITVERADGMFLAGRGLIPTHNSPLAAGLGLFELVARGDAPDVFIGSGSKDQAGIVFDYARLMVEQCYLRDWIRPRQVSLLCPETKGVLTRVSADGNLQHGRMPSAVILDELHVFTTDKQRELHSAMVTALHKRPDSFMLEITTAGSDPATVLGEEYFGLVEEGEKSGSIDRSTPGLTIVRDEDAAQLLWWYSAPDDADVDDEAAWRLANPASWVSVESLRRTRRRRGMRENTFRRLHMNQWTAQEESWLGHGAWDACKDMDAARFVDGEEVWVGVDASATRDLSAIVIVAKTPDGRYKAGSFVYEPDEGAEPIAYALRGHIRDLAKRYRVREVACDPNRFREAIFDLRQEGINAVEYPQTDAYMVPASERAYEYIRDAKVCHSGDRVFAKHVENAIAAQTRSGAWRLAKTKTKKPMDACIAFAIALDRASQPKRQAFIY